MNQFEEIRRSHRTGERFLRSILHGQTDSFVGRIVSLNGNPVWTPNLVQENTMIKEPLTATKFYMRTVSLIRLTISNFHDLFSSMFLMMTKRSQTNSKQQDA